MTPNISKTFSSAGDCLTLQAVDLFCGAGGATGGLLAAGCDVVLSCDNDARAVRAHRALHYSVPCSLRDVSSIKPSETHGRIVWASPSCKPYSFANTVGARGEHHPEYYPLTRLFWQCIGARVLIIENVAGLLYSSEGKAELARLESVAASVGVPMQVLKLRASDVGLEQNRLRVFVILGVHTLINLRHSSAIQGLITYTTEGNTPLEIVAAAQGMTDPTRVFVPDFRSGRRRQPAALVSCLKPHQARRVLGNANPPQMTATVTGLVIEALCLRQSPKFSAFSDFPVQQSVLCQNFLFSPGSLSHAQRPMSQTSTANVSRLEVSA
jgi:hypothetical protein